ncbi:unnamed protein product [Dibothriocephalus latus]|uniref:Uncharacterized protein n=1 Tax=Dibothriocephalus latus TaxID=60516 RepID=A0A3P6S449_DIBLA|nr:unnamed protein product [Dibothriocephalus latus]
MVIPAFLLVLLPLVHSVKVTFQTTVPANEVFIYEFELRFSLTKDKPVKIDGKAIEASCPKTYVKNCYSIKDTYMVSFAVQIKTATPKLRFEGDNNATKEFEITKVNSSANVGVPLNPATAFVSADLELDFEPNKMVPILANGNNERAVIQADPGCPTSSIKDCFKTPKHISNVIVRAKVESKPALLTITDANGTDRITAKLLPARFCSANTNQGSTATWMSGPSVAILAVVFSFH